MKGKSKSSHDLIDDPKLSTQPALQKDEADERLSGDAASDSEEEKEAEDSRKSSKRKHDEEQLSPVCGGVFRISYEDCF